MSKKLFNPCPTPEDFLREAQRELKEFQEDMLVFGSGVYIETEFGPMRIPPEEWYTDAEGQLRIGRKK